MKHKNRQTLFISMVAMMLLSACSYKPVSYYTKQYAHKPVYLEVKISKKEPENGVFLRDALRQAIISRLGFQVTSDKKAASRLSVSYNDISYIPLGYDNNGYVSRYRANVNTLFVMTIGKKVSTINISASHEADVSPSALESSRIKREAIVECSKKAIDQFVAYIGSKSIKSEY